MYTEVKKHVQGTTLDMAESDEEGAQAAWLPCSSPIFYSSLQNVISLCLLKVKPSFIFIQTLTCHL